ncbi:MAG: acetyl-CoA carboxylase biotin carboxyl carrier protein [Deltaproteobacteria bacterium]|nr:acetyl-CoA carboxylase biotin carboxyl carrier protein [Deltaproteobacteria bacterium]
MNLKEIKELIEMIQGTDISEIEVEREGFRTRIRRGASTSVRPEGPAFAVEKVESAVAGEPVRMSQESSAEPGMPEMAPGQVLVTSPMVGTFYRAPSQGAPPFVEVGTEVEPGRPLCIIEAMKLMNEIEAERKGRIVQILKEDKDPVEFGEPLFVLESVV